MSRVVRLPAYTRSREGGSDGKFGVLGLDLGGTSGLAWWHGQLQEGIKETLLGGTFGFAQVGMGLGTAQHERINAETIAGNYRELVEQWEAAGVPAAHRHIAVEDFVLRPKVGSTARVGLASARLAALVEGMLVATVDAEQWHRYSPSRSKGFATSPRLKAWGLWCRSMPHARDAAKQVAIHVASLLDSVS